VDSTAAAGDALGLRELTGSWQYRHMAMIQTQDDGTRVVEANALTAAACLFHGFSDRSRLAIVQHLLLGEHRVVDLTGHLGLAQSTVSKHLACLVDCGIAQVRAQGRASMYSLAHPGATLEVLSAAEKLLALTGDAVTLCPTYGTGTDNGEDAR
jgi:DNA-binding transcriptional ArsR family regulator